VRANARHATVQVSAKGEILDLKNTVNGMVLRLRTLAVEVTRVTLEVSAVWVYSGPLQERRLSPPEDRDSAGSTETHPLTRTHTSRSGTRASWAERRRCRTWRACGLSWLRMCVFFFF
jgi:hypothetical protein